jgi:AraC-like DNA-binding protein
MVRAGISGILFRGLDDVGAALRSALGHADERCLARLVTDAMAPAVPPEARVLIEFCMEHARSAPTVAEIASELGVHRKTLVNWMMQAHLPTPSAVTAWCRILLAARRLDEPGRSVEHVALDLGFGSASELRNMLRRYTGLRPGEIRERGGFNFVLELFLRERAGGVPHRELPVARRRTVRHSRRPYIRRSLRSPHPA